MDLLRDWWQDEPEPEPEPKPRIRFWTVEDRRIEARLRKQATRRKDLTEENTWLRAELHKMALTYVNCPLNYGDAVLENRELRRRFHGLVALQEVAKSSPLLVGKLKSFGRPISAPSKAIMFGFLS